MWAELFKPQSNSCHCFCLGEPRKGGVRGTLHEHLPYARRVVPALITLSPWDRTLTQFLVAPLRRRSSERSRRKSLAWHSYKVWPQPAPRAPASAASSLKAKQRWCVSNSGFQWRHWVLIFNSHHLKDTDCRHIPSTLTQNIHCSQCFHVSLLSHLWHIWKN